MNYPSQPLIGEDGRARCGWVGQDALYMRYHDEEWGVPKFAEQALYAKLVLEGFQAGLSWITILRKRERFFEVFDGFDPEKVARYDAAKIEELMSDAGIVRNRAKINAAVSNAQCVLEMREKTPLASLVWDCVAGTPKQNSFTTLDDVPAQTDMSKKLSKDLKRTGFHFCGPVTIYAFMQSIGIVNDHLVGCHCHDKVANLGATLG